MNEFNRIDIINHKDFEVNVNVVDRRIAIVNHNKKYGIVFSRKAFNRIIDNVKKLDKMRRENG